MVHYICHSLPDGGRRRLPIVKMCCSCTRSGVLSDILITARLKAQISTFINVIQTCLNACHRWTVKCILAMILQGHLSISLKRQSGMTGLTGQTHL